MFPSRDGTFRVKSMNLTIWSVGSKRGESVPLPFDCVGRWRWRWRWRGRGRWRWRWRWRWTWPVVRVRDVLPCASVPRPGCPAQMERAVLLDHPPQRPAHRTPGNYSCGAQVQDALLCEYTGSLVLVLRGKGAVVVFTFLGSFHLFRYTRQA